MHLSIASFVRSRRFTRVLLIAVLVGGLAAATAHAGVEDGALVTLHPGAAATEAVAELRVLETRADGVRLAFELPAIRAEEIQVEGETFHALAIDNGSFDGEPGQPMLPTFTRLIQIPADQAVSWDLAAVATAELTDYRPLPVQPDEGTGFVIDRVAYAAGGYGEAPTVAIGDPALARDLRVVPITIRPVRCDLARGTLEIATHAEIEVRFGGIDQRNVAPAAPRAVPASFDRLYRGLVVNYDRDPGDATAGLGSYVIICQDNAAVIAALQPLIEWRTRKGYSVYLATTTETGSSTTQIQTWLRTAYATWPHPPEYITLIGDASGAVTIPCWNYGGGSTDHPYVQLSGTDLLADAHIGRISVESVAQLELYVYKIVHYESTPYMADTAWYRRGCLVGDPSPSGYSCVQIMQWLKDRMLDVGYAEIDTVFSSPWISQMTNKLNRGDTVFCYRGYWGMSGFDTGYILSLQNGWKMPFAVNITCDTGSFSSGLSPSEAWIRAGLTGSPPTPTGGIASVGTATLGTHSRYNNCVVMGIWRGVFWEDLFHFGEALTRAKVELYLNYWPGDSGGCSNFTHWNNLMGDPAGELWTDVPAAMTVTHPAELALGANAVVVQVASGGEPVEGAYVNLWKGSEIWTGGWTDASGRADLPLQGPTAGDMLVTVTRHNGQPYLGTIRVVPAELFLGYASHAIDDDQSGTSSGNGDGYANPGEAIELRVEVRNFGTLTANDVEGTLSSTDPYVTITDSEESFGTVAGGASAWCADDFDVTIASAAEGGQLLHLALDLHSGAESWHSLMEIPIVAGHFTYEAVTLTGFGAAIDPGESGELSVRIANAGTGSAENVTGVLTTASPWVTISDSTGAFGTVAVGHSGENTVDRFALAAASNCFQGHIAVFNLDLTFSGGARQSISFALQVGTATADDPTGPDAYGYYAFDNTDLSCAQAPAYSWIEIDPNYGGQGVDVGLSDFGEEQDDARVVALPFTFRYYGENFSEITICSNGWIAMGRTRLTHYRNWHIPGGDAPPRMIAPMWDNLYQTGTNRVYRWYDGDNHRYVVQWSRVRNDYGGTTQNFEVILYDPAYQAGETGDGVIVFQYDQFNNSDTLQHYSTTGIENEMGTVGLQYQYFNMYNPGAATIQTGRAIKFVALSSLPRGTLAGVVRNASYGNTPIPLAEVHLLETGETMVTASDGHYVGSIVTGTYTVIASRSGFASATVPGVVVTEGETTQLDFALVDNAGPAFSGTTQYSNTPDATGPYLIQTQVEELSGIAELSLLYHAGGTGWVVVPLEERDGGLHGASIPGQPYNTLVSYYLRGRDSLGHLSADPPTAPQAVYSFWVIEPLLEEDVETGAGPWTHEVVTAGYTDQWHLSQERNHTAGGLWSWKFGDTGTGPYADMADGALISEPFTLESDATLTFWHWIQAETSSVYPDHAFDGGFVEVSLDGGPWTQITPVGGYPYRVRVGSGPGPFPAETPIYSGSFDWAEARFELTGMTGQARVRFRFGSDGSETEEGWYIDDLLLMSNAPSTAGARELELRPARTVLHQNAPNPFGAGGSGTTIVFDLPEAGAVQLEVFDASGRLVRSLVAGELPAGRHRWVWNGRNQAGLPVAGGVYFCVLEHSGSRLARQMLVVR